MLLWFAKHGCHVQTLSLLFNWGSTEGCLALEDALATVLHAVEPSLQTLDCCIQGGELAAANALIKVVGPADAGTFLNLKELQLSLCGLPGSEAQAAAKAEHVFKVLAGLPSLEVLEISLQGIKLCKLPPSLPAMKALKELRITFDDEPRRLLPAVGGALRMPPNLQHLELRNCPVHPKDVFRDVASLHLKSLERATVSWVGQV